MDKQDAELRKTFTSFDEGTRLTCAFESLASENGALGLVTRCEARLHRAFNRSIDRLNQLQKQRKQSGTGIPACESSPETIRQNEPKSPAYVIPIRVDPCPSAVEEAQPANPNQPDLSTNPPEMRKL